MAIELIVNVIILVSCLYAFFYVGATMPVSQPSELGAEQWPQGIIILLVIALGFNIYRLIKNGKGGVLVGSFTSLGTDTAKFLKSKLFIAMVIVLVMAMVYEPLGFMTTSLLFMIAYGCLLGEHRWIRLIAFSLLLTAIFYISFSVFLGVLLPRGEVSFLRNFALWVESIIPTF